MNNQPACSDCYHCEHICGTNYCAAPQLADVLDQTPPNPRNLMTPCEGARDMKDACGHVARWFAPFGG
jgi:hypothetical protein